MNDRGVGGDVLQLSVSDSDTMLVDENDDMQIAESSTGEIVDSSEDDDVSLRSTTLSDRMMVDEERGKFVGRTLKRPLKRPLVTFHANVVACLVVQPDGYTLTDGRTSVSRDGKDSRDFLGQDVRGATIKKLFFLDEYTRDAWWDTCRDYPEHHDVVVRGEETSRCRYCKKVACHRWRATVCGIARLLHAPVVPPVSHSTRYIRKQVVEHYSVAVIAATRGGGFTITDGRKSLSFDEADLRTMAKNIDNFKVKTLYVTDDFTHQLCVASAKRFPIHTTNVQFKRFKDSFDAGRCHYCREVACHRWKAIVGGISRVLTFPVDPIVH
jgi:hypothetical protein